MTDVPNYLVGTSEVVRGFVRFTAQFDGGFGGAPAPDSRAAHELARETEFVGAWGTDPVRQAHSVANLTMLAARDELWCITDLMLTRDEYGERVFGPVTVARTALETAARAWRLFNPEATVEDRVALIMTEHLYGIWQRRKLRVSDAEGERLTQEREQIRSTAHALGMTVLDGGRGSDAISEPRPSATELIASYIESVNGVLGGGVYRFWSAVSHATLAGIFELLHVDGDEELASAEFSLGYKMEIPLLNMTATAYAEAFDRKVAYFGWPNRDWLSWYSSALTQFTEWQAVAEEQFGDG